MRSELDSEALLRCWESPVVVSEHGAVTVAEVQTPDLHVSVRGAGGDERAVLVHTRGRWSVLYIFIDEAAAAGITSITGSL